ncbi:MAG: type IV pilus assembly protein PilM [Candidatus Omnitrophica bacterium]|nr:type IV pilus assembly protein PilM [Candidatus Omnitrophota bacterium]
MFNKKKNNFIYAAIDIGTYSIKILEAVADQGTYTLTKFHIETPSEKIDKKNIQKVVFQALEKANLSAKDIFISLSGQSAVVRFIHMPQMTEEALKQSLAFEADKHMPFAIDDVYINSCILQKKSIDKDKMSVLFAAAKKEVVDQRIQMFKDFGYNVALIDIDAFAVFNAFIMSEPKINKDESFAILNFGSTYTNTVIGSGKIPFFCRDIQIGGEYIIKEAMVKSGLTYEQLISQSKDNEQIKEESLRMPIIQLLDEIRLSFGYYENQYGATVDNVFVTGGFSSFPGILEVLQDALGVNVLRWDPVETFNIGPEIDEEKILNARNSLAVAVGLLSRTDII